MYMSLLRYMQQLGKNLFFILGKVVFAKVITPFLLKWSLAHCLLI
jgi:hypothetical protein